MSAPTDLRIAGDLTEELLDQVRAGLGEPGEWDASVVAALVDEIDRQAAKLEERRVQLRDAHSDLLNIRGILSPNGAERGVPAEVEMVPNAAPAVQWLADERERLLGIINNAAFDLNDTQYPAVARADRAFSHLMQCPDAVFGAFPHGPEAVAAAGAR